MRLIMPVRSNANRYIVCSTFLPIKCYLWFMGAKIHFFPIKTNYSEGFLIIFSKKLL